MAQTFIDAGADYIICPGLIEEVANVADKNICIYDERIHPTARV